MTLEHYVTRISWEELIYNMYIYTLRDKWYISRRIRINFSKRVSRSAWRSLTWEETFVQLKRYNFGWTRRNNVHIKNEVKYRYYNNICKKLRTIWFASFVNLCRQICLEIISSKYHVIPSFSSLNVLLSISSPVAVGSLKARKHFQS